MAAEAQARLNICLRDIITFFEQGGIDGNSIAMLESFIDRHLPMDFLSLAEGFGKCMAFINHDELIALLVKAFNTLIDGYVIEKKAVSKKHKILIEDKKSDPAVIARLEALMADLDSRKQTAEMTNQRLKIMNMVPAAMFRDPKSNLHVLLIKIHNLYHYYLTLTFVLDVVLMRLLIYNV